ncbi:hypothetical protein AB0E71_28415 [Streptomyces narbonensis]|uniref:hypothetical protein n=1 Tax=Streptomyces narbonensis TaxID=67333 RepID=UPI0033F0C807
MADQQLDAFDQADDADRKHAELKDLIRKYLALLQASGLSQNQFAARAGFTSGQVSNTHRPGAYGPNFPRLRLIDGLCTEVQERCGVQDEPIAAFRKLYWDTLAALCARPKPHHSHVLMFTELRHAERIRAITRQLSHDQQTIGNLTADRDALRDDRDGEREQRQTLQTKIDELTRGISSLTAERNDSVLLMDSAREQLDRIQPGATIPAAQEDGRDLDVFHAEHPDTRPVTNQVFHNYQAVSRIPLPVKAAGAVVAAALLVFAGIGIANVFDGRQNTDTTAQDPSRASSPSTADSPPSDSKATQQQPTPSQEPTRTASAPPPASRPHPGEPLPMVLASPGCDTVTEIDFDKVPLLNRVDVPSGEEYEAGTGVDMTFSDCAPEKLRTMTGRFAGTLRKGKEFNKNTCLAAAQGGGLETVGFRNGGTPEYRSGIGEGAVICVLTDQNRLASAKVVKLAEGFSITITLDVSTVV